jgi:hypothetical protein
LKKIAQNVAQHILVKINATVEKSRPKIWTISVIFIELPKVNNHPLSKDSPNMVTLSEGSFSNKF